MTAIRNDWAKLNKHGEISRADVAQTLVQKLEDKNSSTMQLRNQSKGMIQKALNKISL
jgi:hypothetical protein